MKQRFRPAYSFRGSHPAKGLLFATAGNRGDEWRVRARILAAWRPGADVYRIDGLGTALVWAEKRRLDARYATGSLIVAHGAALTSVPPSKSDPPLSAGELLIARAGELVTVPLEAARRIDPSEWLDLGAYRVLAPAPVAAARAVELPPPARVRDARAIGGLGPPDTSLKDIESALAGHTAGRSGGGHSWLMSIAAWISHAFAALRFRTDRVPGRTARAQGTGSDPASHDKPRPRRFAQWFSTWLLRTGLAGVLGQRQAAYVARLLRMFDEGETDEALRHAIRLGGDAEPWSGFGFGLPSPRTSLEISRGRTATRSLLIGGTDLFALLRERYRATAERLIRRGRIAEAAFVLAELLDEPAEAVSLLERQGRLVEAAEIAEGRRLAAGLVVRQWFLAGDASRALRIARRTGAFADAVARLERTDPAQAESLRELWAQTLAASGQYPAAVEVIWPAIDARSQARAWIRSASSLGGPLGARMLVRRAVLEPEALAEVVAEATGLLASAASEDLAARSALFQALLAECRNGMLPASLRALAGPTVRATLRDVALGLATTKRADCERLALAAGQDLLIADMPSATPPSSPPGEPRKIRVTAHPGAPDIVDFVRLPCGRSLLAEGEAGVRLLSRRDRLIKRFDVPARHLVVADNGTRALALAPRGQRWRVSHLQVDRLTCRDLGDLPIDLWADTFDGAEWLVTRGSTLLALDLLSAEPQVSWQASELGSGGIVAIGRNAEALWLLVDGGQIELWRYHLPDLTLRARDVVPVAPAEDDASPRAAVLTNHGDVFTVQRCEAGAAAQLRGWIGDGRVVTLCPAADATKDIIADHNHIVCTGATPAGSEAEVFDRGSDVPRLSVTLDGVQSVTARLFDNCLTVCGASGTALAFDMDTLDTVRSFRL